MILIISNFKFFTLNRLIHSRLVLKCKRCRISRATARTFSPASIQQTGTFIQDAHSAPSVRGMSRSAHKKRVTLNTDCIINECPDNKNKVDTIRPISKDKCCNFSLQIICSKEDDKWYLRHSKDSSHMEHSFHLPVRNEDVDLSVQHLNSNIILYIDSHLKEKVPPNTIPFLVLDKFKTTVCANTICKHYLSNLLEKVLL